MNYDDVPYPKCVHRWAAPETCPMCLAKYKQRCIEKSESALAAALDALEKYVAWCDSESAGPEYPDGLTRDSHPRGEMIWRAWWDANVDLCSAAEDAARAVLTANGRSK